ncbi:MAG: CatB-related O-acetyltransferase [Pseudotabrizicola sp.]|uniref:CatB-related O-acetyltransferase n=1 Tax=Pseudotabrizicola sp. TaxID=2939647 RepID=UPI00273055DF|nr:CatB-related O-acetyltransferase [Pseudotabrizicola sp.]MDP2080150.1 CatB-related O-acetyltransferase [Pseudotabrizicola sp.]MDZ7574976.1 CatB-related O-acetyltransferase [Pseudotabrizicola sp.]
MPFLNQNAMHPLVFPDGRTHLGMVHLNRVINHPNMCIGDHSYANDFSPPEDWASHLAPYLYPGAPERLSIGRFCQIAHGARFITGSANHAMGGFTTYPFGVFDRETLAAYRDSFAGRPDANPDTIIGHDIWIGHGALILPGVSLGHGVIVGAGAVVARDVPDYAIVVGNPARVTRLRFAPHVIARLVALAWWDQPLARVQSALPALLGTDIDKLEAAFAP